MSPTDPSAPILEFNYDISCPYAYIASTRVEALAARTGAQLIWRPVLLGAIYRATAAPQGAAGSASDTFNAAKKEVVSRALARTLARHGVPYHPQPRHPRKTVDALRLLHHVPRAHRPALSTALFKAYWVEGRDVADREVLLALARGLEVADAGALTEAVFEDASAKNELEKATADAVARGAPGVPSFWLPDEQWTREGRLFWGQDRMHLVEASLLQQGGRSVPLKSLIPRCTWSNRLESEVKVEFWYDFSSPWAFLGWTQLDRMKRTFGDGLEMVMKPFLLGALFKEIGGPMVPLAVLSEQRREYMTRDLADWTGFWNAVNEQEGRPDKTIELHWPDRFPIRSPTLLRCAMVEPTCIPLLYRSCWELNANVGEESVLKEVLGDGGFDGSSMVAKTKTQEIKEQLAANTREAVDAGICGVPSYRVFRRHLGGTWEPAGGVVWGQDELAVVEDLICGWDESSGAVATMGDTAAVVPAARL